MKTCTRSHLAANEHSRVPSRSSDAPQLATAGALSALIEWMILLVLSGLGVDVEPHHFNTFIVSPLCTVPGFVFGIVVGALFSRHKCFNGIRYAAYVVSSGLAYFCASQVAYRTFFSSSVPRLRDLLAGFAPLGHVDFSLVIAGIAAGFVGILLLSVATRYLIAKQRRQPLLVPVIIGTLVGSSLYLLRFSLLGLPLLLSFALWQAAYAASLAPILRPRRQLGEDLARLRGRGRK